jgi:diaminohydroxyphosphoribosylaminopyrimidine deaminase/5-amino-6-(5-phosphoribosylamino)uracil reductase
VTSSPPPVAPSSNLLWEQFLGDFFAGQALPPSPLQAIFEPLRIPRADGMVVVGQIGQTMDGRIATVTGQSKYVNGPEGLTHLHQLRALVDAIVIGVGTALADNPQLTVRLVHGTSPARVVIDPRGRLPHQSLVWQDDGIQKIWVIGDGVSVHPLPQVELIPLPAIDGRIDPLQILQILSAKGLRRVLVEGGAETVSRFMGARCFDRLHLIVAPIVMGSGRPSFNLPAIEHMDQAMRLPVKTHLLGNEIVFDCDLQAQRSAIKRV